MRITRVQLTQYHRPQAYKQPNAVHMYIFYNLSEPDLHFPLSLKTRGKLAVPFRNFPTDKLTGIRKVTAAQASEYNENS